MRNALSADAIVQNFKFENNGTGIGGKTVSTGGSNVSVDISDCQFIGNSSGLVELNLYDLPIGTYQLVINNEIALAVKSFVKL